MDGYSPPPPLPDIVDFSPQQQQHQPPAPQQPSATTNLDYEMTYMSIDPPQQDATINPIDVEKDFIALLNDNDPYIVATTAQLIHEWSKKKEATQAISTLRDMIATLALLARRSDCPDGTLYYISSVFNSLSLCPNGQMATIEAGGMICLISMLSSEYESITIHALTAIHNMLADNIQDCAATEFKNLNGVPHIMALLDVEKTHKFLAVVTDCLYRLAYGDLHSQRTILDNNGALLLLKVVAKYNRYNNNDDSAREVEYLIEKCLATLKLLASSIEGKNLIIEHGGMITLGESLVYQGEFASENILKASLLTLRNLSDVSKAINYPKLQPLLQRLVDLLPSPDSTITAYSLGILRNLSCNNQENKNFLVNDTDAIKALLCCIPRWHGDQEAIESVLCTLRHLTRTNQPARHQVAMYGLDFIESIVPDVANVSRQALVQLLRHLREENFDERTANKVAFICQVCDSDENKAKY